MRSAARLRPSLAAALAVALLAAGCGDDGGGEPRGITRDPAPDVSALSLRDATADGADLVLRAEPGHVLLVYFGYTHCPDVCPTTMADVKAARADLGDDAERVDLAMATIDPARDTGELLARYVRSFVPDAHALVTTDDARLRAAADGFGASYGVTTDADGDVEVTHSGFLYAVDDAGALQLTWPFGTSSDDLVHDLELLVEEV